MKKLVTILAALALAIPSGAAAVNEAEGGVDCGPNTVGMTLTYSDGRRYECQYIQWGSVRGYLWVSL